MSIRRHLLFWSAAVLLASATVIQAQEDPADVIYKGPAGIPGTPATPAESIATALATFNEYYDADVSLSGSGPSMQAANYLHPIWACGSHSWGDRRKL